MNVSNCKVQNGLILQETPYLLAVKFPILKKNSPNRTCLTSVNIYVAKNFKYYEKRSRVATMSHTNMLRRSEMQMLFLKNRIEMEGKQ